MQNEVNLILSPSQAIDKVYIQQAIAKQEGLDIAEVKSFEIVKRSIDARSRSIKVHLKIKFNQTENLAVAEDTVKSNYQNVANKKAVLIIGAGPAGLFAALKLIELGIKPIIIERGKDVRNRRRDLAALNKLHIVNPNSNYCFGEGGAGTYSDGKLYTRSTKRGDVNKILNTLVQHGASKEILIDAHPHVGTNKLPSIIINMRESILNAGGEVHFNTCVTDFIVKENVLKGVVTEQYNEGNQHTSIEFYAAALILATGHSARDIFEILHKKNILMEAKPFAMGVRVEHPQEIIDAVQYHCSVNEVATQRQYLPAASYSLVHQANGRGVYSFCMCPGGVIAPCATNVGEVVTNGWSPSKRNNPFANSGMVVAVELNDLQAYQQHGVLAGMRYQQAIEQMAFVAGGSTQVAPAQRIVDFVNNKLSNSLPPTSYHPGIKTAPLHQLLPVDIALRLQEGFRVFGSKMKSFLTNDAILVGVESRTSSTLRIPRDKITIEHLQIKGFYPCGEGAGYAGGIVSAAIDGEKCAEQCAFKLNN